MTVPGLEILETLRGLSIDTHTTISTSVNSDHPITYDRVFVMVARAQAGATVGKRGRGHMDEHTDAVSIVVGVDVLGELALGGADECDRDRIRAVGGVGCGRLCWSGRDHGGQECDGGGDSGGLHVL